MGHRPLSAATPVWLWTWVYVSSFCYHFFARIMLKMLPSWVGCMWFSFAFLTQKDNNFPFFSFINKKLQQTHLCGKNPQLFKQAYEKINCYFCCLKHNTNNYFIADEMLLLWHICACIVTLILFVPADSSCSLWILCKTLFLLPSAVSTCSNNVPFSLRSCVCV